MNKKIILTLIPLLFLGFVYLASASIKTSCPGKIIMELAEENNSHVFEPGSGKPYKICMDSKFDSKYYYTSCPSGFVPALEIYEGQNNGNNAHVAFLGEGIGTKKLCLNYTGDKTISTVSTNCVGDCYFLASLAKKSNSHVGSEGWGKYDVYVNLTTKRCIKVVGPGGIGDEFCW